MKFRPKSKIIITVCIVLLITLSVSVILLNMRLGRQGEAWRVKSFIDNTGDEDYINLIHDADILTARRESGFSTVGELGAKDIFNLYVSTRPLQDKINDTSQWLNEGYGFIEIPVSDLRAFVKQYFGDYQFSLENLLVFFHADDLEYADTGMKYDRERDVILHSTVNGGVFWPGGPDYTETVDSVTAEGDMLTVRVTRHYNDVEIKAVYRNTLTIKITDDGYQYVSYLVEQTDTPDNSGSAPDTRFNFTRIDRLDIDAERNKEIYLLNEDDADKLNNILRPGEWVKATDVPAMGLEPAYMLHDKAGYYAGINSWDDARCLVNLRYTDQPSRNDLYYAPASVEADFNAFMSSITPLPGKVSSEAEWYFDLFRSDPGFKILIDPLTNVLDTPAAMFSDARLATYAIHRLENYSYENGNTKEEYNAIAEKYFRRRISNFDNGMTKTIPGTDRIQATGWSYDNGVFVVMKSDVIQNADGTYTGDFYVYNISDSFWDGENMGYLVNIKEYLLAGNAEAYPEPSIVRVVFELSAEMRNGVQHQYLVYKNIELL